jgi:hypothetical protein
MRPRLPITLALTALTLSCAASSSQAPPEPNAEEVRSFLSKVGAAAASGDETALRAFFEGGSSYPKEDLAMLRSVEFWKLRPARRVKRLGSDAFHINFLPEQPPVRDGAVTMSVRVTVPVRRGRDGQLRVLTRKETERLAKLPVPEDPEGEVVALEHPEEGSLGRAAGTHYATELWADVRGAQVRLSFRFEPPLTGPQLRTDVPLKADFMFGEEVQLKIDFDADANGATGFRMEDHYRRMQEVEKGGNASRPQEIELWKDFGLDKRLTLDGRKQVQGDGTRAWALRATVRSVAPEIVQAGMTRDHGEVVFEKTLGDPEIEVEGDVLTFTVPAALLPMRAGSAYRVMFHENGGRGVILRPQKGFVRP